MHPLSDVIFWTLSSEGGLDVREHTLVDTNIDIWPICQYKRNLENFKELKRLTDTLNAHNIAWALSYGNLGFFPGPRLSVDNRPRFFFSLLWHGLSCKCSFMPDLSACLRIPHTLKTCTVQFRNCEYRENNFVKLQFYEIIESQNNNFVICVFATFAKWQVYHFVQ